MFSDFNRNRISESNEHVKRNNGRDRVAWKTEYVIPLQCPNTVGLPGFIAILSNNTSTPSPQKHSPQDRICPSRPHPTREEYRVRVPAGFSCEDPRDFSCDPQVMRRRSRLEHLGMNRVTVAIADLAWSGSLCASTNSSPVAMMATLGLRDNEHRRFTATREQTDIRQTNCRPPQARDLPSGIRPQAGAGLHFRERICRFELRSAKGAPYFSTITTALAPAGDRCTGHNRSIDLLNVNI